MNKLFAWLPADRTTRFIILAMLGLLVLAVMAKVFLGGGKSSTTAPPCLKATVIVWAPFELRALTALQKPLRKSCITIQLVPKSVEAIATELVPALAAGQGPTLAYIDYDFWSTHRDLFVPLPAPPKGETSALTLDDYPTSIQRALGNRLEAYPFSYDTLVLLWNRDLLNSIGQAEPPASLEALDQLIPQLRRLDSAGQLTLSPIALGSATNIPTHFELFLALWRMRHPNLTKFTSGFSRSLVETLDTYTDYVRSTSPRFSWHPNLPDQREAFLAERTAMIIDFASTKRELLRRNPRAPFALAPLPAYVGRTKRVNYLRPYFLAVTRGHERAGWQALIELDRHYAGIIAPLGLPAIKVSLGRDLNGDNRVLFEELIVGDVFADVNKSVLRPAIRSDIDNWLANRRDVEQLINLQQTSRFFK